GAGRKRVGLLVRERLGAQPDATLGHQLGGRLVQRVSPLPSKMRTFRNSVMEPVGAPPGGVDVVCAALTTPSPRTVTVKRNSLDSMRILRARARDPRRLRTRVHRRGRGVKGAPPPGPLIRTRVSRIEPAREGTSIPRVKLEPARAERRTLG